MMVVTNRYLYQLDVQESLDMPRVFPEGEELLAEASVPQGLRDGLEERGHRIVLSEEALGGGQAIVIDRGRGVLAGGSDCRKDGLALGY
jgi:gamma-glutamyltranspeptidase/glutathione hydrolase